jgi:hypothetical protein
MIEAEHVIAVHHLLGKGVLIVKVIGFCISGTLNDGELYLFELLSFDTCPFRDSFLGIFEDLALSIESVTAW